jgi:hypothetical protein
MIQKWEKYIDENIDDETDKKITKEYVSNLLKKYLPIIFDVNHFSLLTGIRKKSIYSIMNKPSAFYYFAEIPKRSGGIRKISIPFPALMYLQKWILENVLIKDVPHDCATAFYKKRSIITHANIHLGNECLLKLDLENFYSSIPKKRIISVFQYLGYSHNVSYMLASICCVNDCLPQGAPTSPTLSNIVAKRLDKRLLGLTKINEIIYSRYADDLTFSGNYISENLIFLIKKIISEEGFTLNEKKSRLSFEGQKKIITGISISGNKLTLPKNTSRKIRQEVFYIKKYGLKNHMVVTKNQDPIYIDRLLGKLRFWKSIEPNNDFVIKAIKELSLIRSE